MRRLKWRATAAIAVVAVLVLSAGACVYLQNRRADVVSAQSAMIELPEEDGLQRYRTERQQLRSRQRAELNEIIHDAKTDADTLSQAQRQLMSMMEMENDEVQLEGLLAARGFEETLVSVSAGTVNVMLHREALSRRETAIILDLVMRQTGISGGNVKIIPINQ